MIGEAVSTFRGDVAEGQTELRLELPVDAHIPEEYVESERLRLEAYQKLSAAASATAKDDAIDLVIDEMRDRYGEPPAEVDGLIAVARLRRRAARVGLEDVVAMGPNLRIAPAHLEDSKKVRLQRLYPKAKLVSGGDAMVVPLPTDTHDAALIAWVAQLLDALFPEPVTTPAEPQPAPA